MEWSLSLSGQAEKFLARRHLSDDFARDPVERAIKKLLGETVAVDVRKTSGKWEGYYRVRVGKLRIIFSADFETQAAYIEVIDNRGSAYR